MPPGYASASSFLLSLCLHLSLLLLLLEPVVGAFSFGDAGSDLRRLEATPVMMVDLIREEDIPVPPSDTPPVINMDSPDFPEPPTEAFEPPPDVPLADDDPRPSAASPLPAIIEALDRPIPPQLDPAPPVAEPALVEDTTPEAPLETNPVATMKPTKPVKPKPAKPIPAASAGQKAETAAGAGEKGAAGTGGTEAEATRKDAMQTDLLAAWGAKIKARIDRRKVYPKDAKGAKGRTTLALKISRSGQLLDAQVSKSSGNAALDAAAMKAVARAGTFPAAPKDLSQSSYRFTLSISFAS